MIKYFIKVSLTYTLNILLSNLQTKQKFEQDFQIMCCLRIGKCITCTFWPKLIPKPIVKPWPPTLSPKTQKLTNHGALG